MICPFGGFNGTCTTRPQRSQVRKTLKKNGARQLRAQIIYHLSLRDALETKKQAT